VHPEYRPALTDYYRGAREGPYGQQSPSLPVEVLSRHRSFIETGSVLLDRKGTFRKSSRVTIQRTLRSAT
jgi:hypothetical protein